MESVEMGACGQPRLRLWKLGGSDELSGTAWTLLNSACGAGGASYQRSYRERSCVSLLGAEGAGLWSPPGVGGSPGP